ncbi:MAG TPA: tetratricopeptide repeat protein [Longimicrobiales bacterium]|jgi:tetratricopeptide (TPR) repeat protein
MTDRRTAAPAVALAALFALAAPALAQEEIVLEGNRLYQAGEYARALDAYRQVAEAGFESATLYYNLGNAHFKTGDLPRAILNYERAARMAPGAEDVRANLDLARSLTVDDIEPLQDFWLVAAVRWWVDLVPRALLAWTVAAGWLLAGAAVLGLILGRSPGLRRASARGGLIAAAVVVIFGMNLAVRELGRGRAAEGVILVREVAAQSAPSPDPNLTVFSIHAGTKVRLDEVSDGWAEVVLEDGRVGWVPTVSFERI